MGIQTPARITQRLRSRVSPRAALGVWGDAVAGSVASHCSLQPVVPVPSWPLPPARAASWSVGAAWRWGGEAPLRPSVMLSCPPDAFGEQQGALLLQSFSGQVLPAHVLNLPVSFSVHFPCTTHTTSCSAEAQPKGTLFVQQWAPEDSIPDHAVGLAVMWIAIKDASFPQDC